jgi:hypothetical protein
MFQRQGLGTATKTEARQIMSSFIFERAPQPSSALRELEPFWKRRKESGKAESPPYFDRIDRMIRIAGKSILQILLILSKK